MEAARHSSRRFRLLDRPMVHLADALDGVRFTLWLPLGTRRTDASRDRAELTYEVDADGDQLAIVVELAHGRAIRTLAEHVAFWSGLGDEIRRASSVVDGYLLTSLGPGDVNAVRQLRLGGAVLQVWARLRWRRETLDAQLVWLEAIASSLALS